MSGSLPSLSMKVSGYRLANTRQGDTLQRISLREQGDPALWHGLIYLNNLLPPYITDNAAHAGARVLLAGSDKIKIPSSSAPATGGTDEDSIYLVDLSLADGLLDATSEGDLLTISGVPNLAQALRMRFDTHLRDLIWHKDYGNGCYDLLGEYGNDVNLRLAAVYVGRAFLADDRIASLQSCVATLVGDTINVNAVGVATDGKLVPFSNLLTMGAGGTLSLLPGVPPGVPLPPAPPVTTAPVVISISSGVLSGSSPVLTISSGVLSGSFPVISVSGGIVSMV